MSDQKAWTVRELIAELSKLPEEQKNLRVLTEGCDCYGDAISLEPHVSVIRRGPWVHEKNLQLYYERPSEDPFILIRRSDDEHDKAESSENYRIVPDPELHADVEQVEHNRRRGVELGAPLRPQRRD